MHKNIRLIPLFDTVQFIRMSDEEYFSSKWSGYISNSLLSLINPEQGGSPKMYEEGLREHSKYSDSLIFGSAVHELVLQPDDFILVDNVNRPTAKMGAMADELYKAFLNDGVSDKDIIAASDKVDYYKGKMDETKIENVRDKCMNYWQDRQDWESRHATSNKEPIYLDPKSREKLQLCLSAIEANKELQGLLHPEGVFNTPIVINEGALFMDVKAEDGNNETILKLKGKLDNFTIDTDTNEVVLNDLKTTGHWLCNFNDSFEKYHYARQMAMYSFMLQSYVKTKFGIDDFSQSVNMLLSCTVPDYRSGIFKVTNKQIHRGLLEFKDLLQRVAYFTMYGSNGSMESNV